MIPYLRSRFSPPAMLLLVLISPWMAHSDEGTAPLGKREAVSPFTHTISRTAAIPLLRLTVIMEFLRSLRDNQYISDDAYAHGKKTSA